MKGTTRPHEGEVPGVYISARMRFHRLAGAEDSDMSSIVSEIPGKKLRMDRAREERVPSLSTDPIVPGSGLRKFREHSTNLADV
jgi:hypothetical protein